MKVGITLPQFRHSAEPALAVAREAEARGLDGVFVFDHMWPLRQPQRPALYSTVLLGAVAAETEIVTLGPLVARVSVLPNAVLVHAMLTLSRLLGSRLVVALGTGDGGNRDENEAYGVGFPPLVNRVADAVMCARELRAAGITTWLGGCSLAIRQAAVGTDGWNAWGRCAEPSAFEAAAAAVRQTATAGGDGADPEISWGGQVLVGASDDEIAEKLARFGSRPGLVAGTVETLRHHLRRLAEMGASWAVCAPIDVGTDPRAVEMIAEAASACR